MNRFSPRLRPRIGGAVYLLPNLLTTGNLFFGYLSIIKSLQGDFSFAAQAILLAAIFDVLDGQVARLTRGTSEFGVQYDSLCDLVSFGLAPAFLMYQFALTDLGRIGWILCFIFLACGALRLARFNVQSALGKTSSDFTGLPIPMAAGLIACYVGFIHDSQDYLDSNLVFLHQLYLIAADRDIRQIFLVSITPVIAGLMVSNIVYRSHKSLNIRAIKAFRLLAILVVFLGLAAYKPLLTGFLFFFCYALSGPFEWLLGWKKATDDDDIFAAEETDEGYSENVAKLGSHEEGR